MNSAAQIILRKFIKTLRGCKGGVVPDCYLAAKGMVGKSVPYSSYHKYNVNKSL